MKALLVVIPLFVVASSFVATAAFAAATKIVVRAGDSDRHGTPVSFMLPPESKDADMIEAADNNFRAPLQADAAGRASFLLTALPRGKTATFKLLKAGASGSAVNVQRAGSVLKMSQGGRALLHYQMDASEVPGPEVSAHFRHGAYLHPVFSPGGKVVTGDYPADHRWHRGIWFAWTKTEFEGRHPDFWNMGKEKDGSVTAGTRFESLVSQWSGAVHGGFVSRHRFFDNTTGAAKDVLNETWEVRVYRTDGAVVLFDLTSTQTCAGNAPLKLPEYHYGGLGVRGNAAWDPKDKVAMGTSAGHDRKTGDRTKAKWIHMFGDVDGVPAGMVILIHPDNFRFPQPLRLNPSNPQLCIAPSQGGDWEISPGKPYVSKYRFVTFDGSPDNELIERLWNDYAHPPVVTVAGR